jgi:outer membrane protein OmpA-like peptidoglycan-associated protein/tetratricopeptide (TPR) repeat protein
MMRYNGILVACFFVLSQSLIGFSQVEEDEACLPPDKKIVKLIEKAKTTAAPASYKIFQQAIDANSDNAMAFFEYALSTFKEGQEAYSNSYDPGKGDRLMIKARSLFEKSLEKCADYHADVYYYLGGLYYMEGNNALAFSYFNKFLKFESLSDNRYPKDYDKKKKEVQKLLGESQKEADLYANKVPFDPRIVKNVSTSRDEFFPMISPDNELIFFTRRVDKTNKGDFVKRVVEEFTMAKRLDVDHEFDGGAPIPPPFNDGTFDNYGAATVSVDNKEMIICACKFENFQGQEYKNCDLYITYFERGEGHDFKWTPLQNMGSNINTKDGWEGQPSLSADGNTLYFTAVRPSTKKDDIFMSKRKADGTWTVALPVEEINTPGKDKSPFLHQDSHTLYFVSESSNERDGIGGLDIFYSQMGKDGKWGTPKNIGYPINTTDDEIGLFVSTDGKQAYFSSRVGGVWNIYSFELYKEARPKAVVLVKGELKDPNGDPVKDAEVEIAYGGSDRIDKIRVNGDDGKYAAIIAVEDDQEPEDIMVTVKKEGHAFDSKLISKETLAENTFIKETNMELRKIEVGVPYTINDILYATNSDELSSNSKFILKQFARFLKENPTIKVSIQGHTDDVGDDDKNLKLSDKRANGVKTYLVSLGIDAKRLKAKGYGETQPSVPNTSAENRAKNRRTDFVIEEL